MSAAMIFTYAMTARAGDGEAARLSLIGIERVYVVVENVSEPASNRGVTMARLQGSVEAALRKSGIQVISEKQALQLPTVVPFLYVNLHAVQIERGPIAYNVDVEVHQSVLLGQKHVTAVTWSVGMLGVTSTQQPENMQRHVLEQVDRFISAYLDVNPRR
jgi:hypothetical protein